MGVIARRKSSPLATSPSTTATRRSPYPSKLGEEYLDQILPISDGEGDRSRKRVVEGQPPPHTLQPHQPCGLPLFCWSSQVFSGAKYSTSALPDISRLPVKTWSASGHGLDWPIASIAFSFSPTFLLP